MLIAKYARFLPGFSKEYLIQIGAHAGHEASILEAAGFRSIAWIEADPAIYQHLKENIARYNGANHSTHNALITSTSGKYHRFFRYSNHGASSSLYRSTGWFSQTFEGVQITDDSIELSSLSLDDFISVNHIVPSCLIVDVQGAELEVLMGGIAALRHASIVEVEISQQEIYEGGALFDSVDGFLSSHGFTRITHVPWHGDVLYIKILRFNWKTLSCLFCISVFYCGEYYSTRLRRLIRQLIGRPRVTLSKLTSRIRGKL